MGRGVGRGGVFTQAGILGCESRVRKVVEEVGGGEVVEDVEVGSVTCHYRCVAG